MHDSHKIGRTDSSLNQGGAGQNEYISTGKWQGQRISIIVETDVDDTIFADQLKTAFGLNASPDHRILEKRQIECEQRLSILSQLQIQKYGNATGSNSRQSKLAQNYLRHFFEGGTKPKIDSSVSSLMQHYMSLQTLLNALKAGEPNFTPLLTPSEKGPARLDEWLEELQAAGDDTEKISQTFKDVDGLPKNRGKREELYQLMKSLRFQPEEFQRKLKDLQNLPEFDEPTRNALLESVQDEIRNLDYQHKSTIQASLSSITDDLAPFDPSSLENEENEELLSNKTFTATLKYLLEEYPSTDIPKIVPKLIRSHGDQLRSLPLSCDEIQLNKIIQDIISLRITLYLFHLTDSLSKMMSRLYSMPLDTNKLIFGIKDILGGIWISPQKFQALANDMQVKDVQPCIIFLQRIMHILRDLPLQIFTDDATRSAILGAVQTATDNAISREEMIEEEKNQQELKQPEATIGVFSK